MIEPWDENFHEVDRWVYKPNSRFGEYLFVSVHAPPGYLWVITKFSEGRFGSLFEWSFSPRNKRVAFLYAEVCRR